MGRYNAWLTIHELIVCVLRTHKTELTPIGNRRRKQQQLGKKWNPQNQPKLLVLELEESLEYQCISKINTRDWPNFTSCQPTYHIQIPLHILMKSMKTGLTKSATLSKKTAAATHCSYHRRRLQCKNWCQPPTWTWRRKMYWTIWNTRKQQQRKDISQ